MSFILTLPSHAKNPSPPTHPDMEDIQRTAWWVVRFLPFTVTIAILRSSTRYTYSKPSFHEWDPPGWNSFIVILEEALQLLFMFDVTTLPSHAKEPVAPHPSGHGGHTENSLSSTIFCCLQLQLRYWDQVLGTLTRNHQYFLEFSSNQLLSAK